MIPSLTTPKGLISFRIASTEDAAMLLELRLEALSSYPEAFAADAAMTAADGAEMWVQRITDYAMTQSGAISLALAGDELVGMAGIVRGHWPKTRHSGTLW